MSFGDKSVQDRGLVLKCVRAKCFDVKSHRGFNGASVVLAIEPRSPNYSVNELSGGGSIHYKSRAKADLFFSLAKRLNFPENRGIQSVSFA
jgi:hypothetical protein